MFGILVYQIILSIAADFNCLSLANLGSFKGGLHVGKLIYLGRLFEYFYFSVVTFVSVCYVDIVPVTILARLLVIMEIGQSFVTVVFGLSNINNIHISDKNQ